MSMAVTKIPSSIAYCCRYFGHKSPFWKIRKKRTTSVLGIYYVTWPWATNKKNVLPPFRRPFYCLVRAPRVNSFFSPGYRLKKINAQINGKLSRCKFLSSHCYSFSRPFFKCKKGIRRFFIYVPLKNILTNVLDWLDFFHSLSAFRGFFF